MDIDPNQLFTPQAVEDRRIAKKQTLAQWRHEGKGPAYIKSGSRILYSGADIIKWLNEQRVEPTAA